MTQETLAGPETFTPDMLLQELELRGMSQSALARALGVDRSTISRWLDASRPIPGWLRVALRGLPKRRKTA